MLQYSNVMVWNLILIAIIGWKLTHIHTPDIDIMAQNIDYKMADPTKLPLF